MILVGSQVNDLVLFLCDFSLISRPFRTESLNGFAKNDDSLCCYACVYLVWHVNFFGMAVVFVCSCLFFYVVFRIISKSCLSYSRIIIFVMHYDLSFEAVNIITQCGA